MNITQETVDNFVVGRGGADAVGKQIIASGFIAKAYKGVRVRAATANTIVIYVGKENVTAADGYPLPAGEEVNIPIEDPSEVYVVAAPASNCQQTVILSGQIVGDTFTLTFDGETTAPISVSADAAAVQAALQLLSTIGAGNCLVTDTGGISPYTVTFIGALAKTDVDLMTATGTGVNEKQNITITDTLAGDRVVLTFGANSTPELAYDSAPAQIQTALRALASIGAGNVNVTAGATGWDVEFVGTKARTDVAAISGVCGKNEKQTITLDAGVSDGTFTLAFGGQTTGALAYGISAADLQIALRALTSINGPNVFVTAGTPGWVVEFIGTLARADVAAITGDGANLVGDVKDVTVVETIKGNGATVTVTETQKGDEGCAVTVAKVADITLGSQYSWIVC